MANTLITLPPEIVHHILKYVDPKDLASVARTCWALQRCVVRDRLLWKEVWGMCFVSSFVFFCFVLFGLSWVWKDGKGKEAEIGDMDRWMGLMKYRIRQMMELEEQRERNLISKGS